MVAGLQVRPTNCAPPCDLDRVVEFSVRMVGGWVLHEVSPRRTTSTRHARYLHGGTGIQQITTWHWSLVAELSVATSTRFTVPMDPFALRGRSPR